MRLGSLLARSVDSMFRLRTDKLRARDGLRSVCVCVRAKRPYFQWRAEGGGVWGVQPPPPKFRRPSKIVPNSTRF